MFVANRGTEFEWSCDCCDPNGFHHHDDETCEHPCCPFYDGDESNPEHDDATCDHRPHSVDQFAGPQAHSPYGPGTVS
jgi:hypothetical protein